MTDTVTSITAKQMREIDDGQDINNMKYHGNTTSPMSRLVREKPNANSVLGKGPKESSDDGKSESSSQSTVSTVPPFSQPSEPDQEEVEKMMTVKMTDIFAIAAKHYPPPKKTVAYKTPKLKLTDTTQSTLSKFFKRT